MDLTYFNPNSQREADFLASFVARQGTLDFLLRQLRAVQPGQVARHHLIVAPRGFGKTSLLRRIAIAVRTDPTLRERFIALRFREEQHNVISLDVLWRNCLQSLLEAREDEGATQQELDELDADWVKHAPRQGLPREAQDGEPAWQTLQARCEALQRRPVLLIDNLDTLLAGLGDQHQWGFRKRLQADDGPVLLAAASRYPEATHDPKAAFFEFFRIQPLDKLDDQEVFACLRNIAAHRGAAGQQVLQLLDREPGRVAALNTLAGGNPRTLSVLYGVLESHMSGDVLSQLSAMLDTFTGWYQARTEELPMQARAVFDALALNWDPMTAASLGQATGLDTPAVSSQLSRLERAGYVETVALSRRKSGRNGYQVSERFFNIWYLMRNGPRRARQSIRFLTTFLQSCFSAVERHSLASAALQDREADPGYVLALAASLKAKRLRAPLLDHARERSLASGQAGDYQGLVEDLRREWQLETEKPIEPAKRSGARKASGAGRRLPSAHHAAGQEAEDLLLRAFQHAKRGELEEAVRTYDEVVARFGEATGNAQREAVARALVNKGVALGKLGQTEQAIRVYGDVVARFGEAAENAQRQAVARALVNKGFRLGLLGRTAQAIRVYDEVVARFGEATEDTQREAVARALVNKGIRLGVLGRTEQAIQVYDDVVARFGEAAGPALREQVARALFNKGFRLGVLGETEQEIRVYDDVVARFGEAAEPALHEQVARALVNKGLRLGELGQTEEAIRVCDDVVARFGKAAEPALHEQVARALVNKGFRLGELRQMEQAIRVYDDVVARFGEGDGSVLREQVARALVNKGVRLDGQGETAQAIQAYDDVVARFGEAAESALREQVAMALFNKGITLGKLGESEQAIRVYDDVVARFGEAAEPALREQVARALVNKGFRVGELGHVEQAIQVYDDVVARFGEAAEPALREQVAMALVNKGITLGELGQTEQAIRVNDDVVARFGKAVEPALRERVAIALVNKGIALGALGQAEQEIRVYDDVVARCGEAAEPALRKQIAQAMFYKGITLGELGQAEEAIRAYDAVIARFGEAAEVALLAQAAGALVNKAVTLGELGQTEEAIRVCDDVVARFGAAAEPPLREQVAMAMVNKGVALGELGRMEQAIQAYDDMAARFGAAAEPALRQGVATALGLKASALQALGRFDDSEAAYREAIAHQASPSTFNRLGNLLLDFKADLPAARAAYEAGLAKAGTSDITATLHSNLAYLLALHEKQMPQSLAHVAQALADASSISVAGRHLLEGLQALGDGPQPNWQQLFDQVDKAVTADDPTLWSDYLDDLQRLLWFVIAQGKGADFKQWMDSADYRTRFAPLYHAFVAALEGEDHLLQINPETRAPAVLVHAGLARMIKLHGPGREGKSLPRSKA
ncbi:tetratricopeptide repeat protein [Roseateles sp.]|uniref:tetratricopeptide repeat protein n=1 Tax=Roseateles sp. TaxID=1971397 RepID=UPI002DF8FFDA|nr:tetratricopeptide repeat protein [Roseateles sp.]HEV6964020.1 tetratricopeptide repeat protein [Roseateles sp.]